ncbi:hypothetical protein ABPG75_002125 [Micractinium tetrahymenae]
MSICATAACRASAPIEADKPCLALQPYDPLWQGIAAANPDLAPLLESMGSLQVNILPKATGRAEPPRWALSRPPAFDGTGAWSASAVYVDLEARVDPALEGMPLAQVEDCSARAAAALLRAGRCRAALAAATATLQLAPHLSFGTCDTALPCAAAIRAAQGIVRAAAEAGTPVTPTDAVQLLEAAARADPCLRLGKWYGHAFGDTVERHIADGWGSAELALRYLAAWCALVAAGTLQYTATRHEALVEAVMKEGKSDRPLSAGQRRHLLATERTLPAECTSTVNTWLAGLPAEVERRCGASAVA